MSPPSCKAQVCKTKHAAQTVCLLLSYCLLPEITWTCFLAKVMMITNKLGSVSTGFKWLCCLFLTGVKNDGGCKHIRWTARQHRRSDHPRGRHKRRQLHFLQWIHKGKLLVRTQLSLHRHSSLLYLFNGCLNHIFFSPYPSDSLETFTPDSEVVVLGLIHISGPENKK